MALVALISREEKPRRELTLAIQELGHRVVEAVELREGLELLKERPQLVVAVEPEGERLGERLLAELEREAPLIPVVVAPAARSAARALELLKAGAYEVLAPPWTPEGVSACVSKALRFKGTAFELVRRPDWLRRNAYAFTAVAVLATALAFSSLEHWWRTREARSPVPATASYDLPYSHPAGLAFDGRGFWITDWFSQTLYRHDARDLRAIRARHFPEELPGALGFAGEALWAAAAPHRLVKHMLDDNLTVLAKVDDATGQTVGLAYDGLFLWTCDAKTGALHKRLLDETLSVVASFPYPGGRPAGLVFDGKSLWSLDAGNRELLRHDLDSPGLIAGRLPLPEYRAGGLKPVGLAWDGKHFWTVAERSPNGDGPARIFMHSAPPERP